MDRILVLCTGNSCRSQMAHGILETLGKQEVEVYSAGIETHGLNPNAVRYLKEAEGIDISHHTSNNIDEYKGIEFDYIITVCDHANENCPYFPSMASRIHHNFKDPSKVEGSEEEIRQAFLNCIAEIKSFCEDFLKTRMK